MVTFTLYLGSLLTCFFQAEQAERRRLEDELRAVKKQQGPGKSGLSQSIAS